MNIMRVAILLFVICWSVISHGQDDRARFVPPDEIVWLKDATEKDVQYLALQLEPLRSFERGQFVALPDWGLHPCNLRSLNPVIMKRRRWVGVVGD